MTVLSGRHGLVLLTALLIAGACIGAPPETTPTTPPSRVAPSVWVYERTLLPPKDASTYENVLLDAKPLADGGWVVLRAVGPRRYLVDPTCYGCFVLQPYGELLKLDASGRIVAREHAAEPLGLTKIDVFEDGGVVVGQGRQVRNGTVHALRLDTLDGIASELTNCLAIDSRCWSFRTVRYQGSTTLEQRDPRTLAVVRTYPQLTMDGLSGQPAIFPSANLIAWQPPISNPAVQKRGVRAEALDPTRPIAIGWIDRLREACDVARVGDDRAWLEYGPPGCDGDSGWRSELVEVSSGRVLRRFGSSDGVWGNELALGRLLLSPLPVAIDPRSGLPGPIVPDRLVALDFDRGVAAVALTGGGAAVLRRQQASALARSVAISQTASGRCRDVDFPRLLVGPADFSCSDLTLHLRAGQLLVATGRNFRDPVDFDVTGVTVDEATHQIEIAYRSTERAARPLESGPVRAIDLGDPPPGEWLVHVAGEGDLSRGGASTFVVRFPHR